MVIYVTIVLNVYLRLLYHIYEKRGDFSAVPAQPAEPAKDNRTSVGISSVRDSGRDPNEIKVTVETKKSK